VTRLSFSRQEAITDVLAYLVFAVALLFFGFPLLWVLSLSIRTAQEVYVTSLQLIPDNPTIENYLTVLGAEQFSVYLWNSLKLTLAGSLGAIVVASPAAYSFSRLRFRGNKVLLVSVLGFSLLGARRAVDLMHPWTRRDVVATGSTVLYGTSFETGDVGRDPAYMDRARKRAKPDHADAIRRGRAVQPASVQAPRPRGGQQ
jgi:hypothetical protein